MTQLQLEVQPTSVWHMYRAMVGVGVMCGLLIVTVFQLTRPVIERNKAEALQRAIFQVLPDARSRQTFRLTGEERSRKRRACDLGGRCATAGRIAIERRRGG